MRYRLFFVTASGRYVRSLEVEHDTDSDAIGFAESVATDLGMVLWQKDRIVKQFPKVESRPRNEEDLRENRR